jgi:ATP-dependent helicase HrpB
LAGPKQRGDRSDMQAFCSPLPIDAVLPDLATALSTHSTAVLVAPPGAGKSTRVPLVLATEPWAQDRKLLVLTPRRLAARAAADRMARTIGEVVGETVGYRVRFGSKTSSRTRIEVVTEGVFTRLLLDDPELKGIAAVAFDEFHERSLDADLGLALARDVQLGLRPDLKLLVMSATLDGARIATLLGEAPVITSEGRAFPVETRYVGRDPRLPIETQVANLVAKVLRSEPGSILVFLPGAAEIRRTGARLNDNISDPSIDIVPLFGALDADAQDRAIAPSEPGRRKIVLATSIAETSLTIEGVKIVVDSGLARVPRYEPDVGLTRLETVRVSRASAEQRRGRAGRLEPGLCYRLWEEPQTASLEPFNKPEILSAELSSLLLDLAQWGVTDPDQLAFLDPPPEPALAEARVLLRDLHAIDADGRITEEGTRLRQLPLAPRLARMVVDAARIGGGKLAAEIAVILTERGIGGNDVDLRHRLDSFRRDRSARAQDARRMAQRWKNTVESRTVESESSAGALLALAYPDRIAKNRGGGGGSFLLANGRGGIVDIASALATEPFLVVAELAGTAAQSHIVLAAPITLSEIEAIFGNEVETRGQVVFDSASLGLRGRRSRRLGAIVLAEQPLPVTPTAETARILSDSLAKLGLDHLPWTRTSKQWRNRVMFLRRAEGGEWPDLSNEALVERADEWLQPLLAGKTTIGAIHPEEIDNALAALLPFPLRHRLDAEAPTHLLVPSGSRIAIDYEAEEGPKVSVRVQELFGLDRHPTIAAGRVSLVLELLSPANRPVQITRDLPGFWRGSYAAVRSEMKGRYPRHPWPDDPLTAPATRRTKPRR